MQKARGFFLGDTCWKINSPQSQQLSLGWEEGICVQTHTAHTSEKGMQPHGNTWWFWWREPFSVPHFKVHIGLVFNVASQSKLSLLGPWASRSPLGLLSVSQVVVKLSLKKKRRFWLSFWSLSPDIQLFPECLGDVIFLNEYASQWGNFNERNDVC